jgi:hypothetical protein
VRLAAGAFVSRFSNLISQRIDETDGLIMFDNVHRGRSVTFPFSLPAQCPDRIDSGRARGQTGLRLSLHVIHHDLGVPRDGVDF